MEDSPELPIAGDSSDGKPRTVQLSFESDEARSVDPGFTLEKAEIPVAPASDSSNQIPVAPVADPAIQIPVAPASLSTVAPQGQEQQAAPSTAAGTRDPQGKSTRPPRPQHRPIEPNPVQTETEAVATQAATAKRPRRWKAPLALAALLITAGGAYVGLTEDFDITQDLDITGVLATDEDDNALAGSAPDTTDNAPAENTDVGNPTGPETSQEHTTESETATDLPFGSPSVEESEANRRQFAETSQELLRLEGQAEGTDGRVAVFRDGKLFLSGPVPSSEAANAEADRLRAILGPESVEVDYTIDPDAELKERGALPLVVEDALQFELNSTEISENFYPVLDVIIKLLRAEPLATITVITTTDATGSTELNSRIALERANAIKAFLITRRVSIFQVKVDPRGESEAKLDASMAEAAEERRAEFIITGVLG